MGNENNFITFNESIFLFPPTTSISDDKHAHINHLEIYKSIST